jgi:putative membrane protein
MRGLSRSLRWLALAPVAAWAHHAPGDASSVEPWAFACLVVSVVLYATGVARLWKKAGPARGIGAGDVARFAAGWLALCAALLPPLEAVTPNYFAAHMLQHELLMVVAAPLLVRARPLEAWTWALSASWRSALGDAVRSRWLRRLWGAITEPVGAWCLHAIAIWAWHIPSLFEAAVANTGIHILQHASFFATALLFWWSVSARGARGRDGVALASIFTTMLHTSALGALLTFAPSPWYAPYAAGGALGLSPLEDQQLGGLVMWVPGGFAYVVAGLALAWRWLRRGPAALSFR